MKSIFAHVFTVDAVRLPLAATVRLNKHVNDGNGNSVYITQQTEYTIDFANNRRKLFSLLKCGYALYII